MNIKVFINPTQNAHILPCMLGNTTFNSARALMHTLIFLD